MATGAKRRLRGAAVLLMGFGAMTLGCGTHRLASSALETSGPEALAAGRADFQAACAPCHGLDARGGGPVAPSLKTPPPDLTLLAGHHAGTFPADDVVAVIAGERQISAHGTRTMPIWSQRFGPGHGATAVASIHARRRLEMLARYLGTLQR